MSSHTDYSIKKRSVLNRRRTTEYHKASETIERQPGFRDIKNKPEEIVKKFLCDWLESKGCKVYWEKENCYGKPVFKTTIDVSGTCERPDLLIEITDYFGIPTYYAIEAKDARSNSNVYDSFPQVLRYAKGELGYSINELSVVVSGYFVASMESINGRLFHSDILNRPETFSEGRQAAINRGDLPRNEFILTEQYLRLLWRMAKEYEIEGRIGALLSTVLNGDEIPKPMIQYSDIRKDAGFQGFEVWQKLNR